MRSVLRIEYEYVRIYMNSFTLGAFVERAVASTPSKQNAEVSTHPNSRNDSVASNGPTVVPPEVVRNWMQDDYPHVQDLVNACQNVLQIVGEGIISPNRLRHLPIRTYFRVMIASVFLLKVCSIYFLFPLSDILQNNLLV